MLGEVSLSPDSPQKQKHSLVLASRLVWCMFGTKYSGTPLKVDTTASTPYVGKARTRIYGITMSDGAC